MDDELPAIMRAATAALHIAVAYSTEFEEKQIHFYLYTVPQIPYSAQHLQQQYNSLL